MADFLEKYVNTFIDIQYFQRRMCTSLFGMVYLTGLKGRGIQPPTKNERDYDDYPQNDDEQTAFGSQGFASHRHSGLRMWQMWPSRAGKPSLSDESRWAGARNLW